MYSGTFLIVGLAWQGHQSANIPCQDEGGDLSFLEYLTRHVYGRLPCRFFNMSTLMSAALSYRQSRRCYPSSLHPSDTTPPVTQTGLTGRRAERLNQSILHHYLGTATLQHHYHSTPFPFDTTPLKCQPFTMSALHHVRHFSISSEMACPGMACPGMACLDDEPLEGNSIEELFQGVLFQGVLFQGEPSKGQAA